MRSAFTDHSHFIILGVLYTRQTRKKCLLSFHKYSLCFSLMEIPICLFFSKKIYVSSKYLNRYQITSHYKPTHTVFIITRHFFYKRVFVCTSFWHRSPIRTMNQQMYKYIQTNKQRVKTSSQWPRPSNLFISHMYIFLEW